MKYRLSRTNERTKVTEPIDTFDTVFKAMAHAQAIARRYKLTWQYRSIENVVTAGLVEMSMDSMSLYPQTDTITTETFTITEESDNGKT